MFILTRKMLLAAGLATALVAMSGVASADAVSQDMIDARQESLIWATCALSPHLRGYRLQALVQSGMVRLTGTVAENAERELAAEFAHGVKGVRQVDNQILVQPGTLAPKPTAERSYAETVDDAAISAEVKLKIAWSRAGDGLLMRVDTTRGAVRLRGMADSEAAKGLAGRLAETTRGVLAVDNQLTVTGPQTLVPLSGTAQTVQEELRGSDSWMTAKVKSTLLYSLGSAANEISVSTSAGEVTLTGRAKNSAEQALAIELAQYVRGVRSVNQQGYTF